jgi:hypothetical protein
VTTLRLDAKRTSRVAGDGTIEDRCDRCGEFRPRRFFVPGGAAVCRTCRARHRPAVVGPLAPTGVAPPPAPEPDRSRRIVPPDYELTRGRYAGRRLAEVPLAYLRACAYGRGSAIPTRAHIPWGNEVRMIRLYLQELESEGS